MENAENISSEKLTPGCFSQHPPLNLLLVDDHHILRQGMKQLLEMEEGIHICGESDNGEDAILKALSLKPDIILMDINLPKANGYAASKAILTAWPTAKIVILTNQDDGEVLKKLMDLDIKGYFLKDIQADELVERLYQVMDGERIGLSPDLDQKMKLVKSTAAASSHFSLTEREREVLIALSKGYSNQQLADLLTVSPKTVHNHLYNIYSKIGVSSRSEAIVWAIQANLEGQGSSGPSF